MPSPSSSFQPTWLDFISFPNPIEPNTFDSNLTPSSGRHSGIVADEDFFWSLRGSRLDHSPGEVARGARKRRSNGHLVSSNTVTSVLNPADIEIVSTRAGTTKVSDQAYFQLPLPAQRVSGHQRERVPPVLQGLHQPPPNAGLLPSISIEKRKEVAPEQVTRPASTFVPTHTKTDESSTAPLGSRQRTRPSVPGTATRIVEGASAKRRKKWTFDESLCLLSGAQRFGVGAWKAILNCADYTFDDRRPLDLKDRFRVLSDNPTLVASLLTQWPSTVTSPSLASDTNDSVVTTLGSFRRTSRRTRTRWSVAEDSALLAGLRRYGRSWSSIQLDPLLTGRTPTDVRDRIRTRFPVEYAGTGRASRPAAETASVATGEVVQAESDNSTGDGSRIGMGKQMPRGHVDMSSVPGHAGPALGAGPVLMDKSRSTVVATSLPLSHILNMS